MGMRNLTKLYERILTRKNKKKVLSHSDVESVMNMQLFFAYAPFSHLLPYVTRRNRIMQGTGTEFKD